jgi:hypothetical protein
MRCARDHEEVGWFPETDSRRELICWFCEKRGLADAELSFINTGSGRSMMSWPPPESIKRYSEELYNEWCGA